MEFEIIKDSTTIFRTPDISCIPDKNQLDKMAKAGYKFKIDGKAVTKKKLEDILSEGK